MSLTTIFAPSAANRVAMPRPNPEPPPVTIAILLASRIGGFMVHDVAKMGGITGCLIYVSFPHQTASSRAQTARFLHVMAPVSYYCGLLERLSKKSIRCPTFHGNLLRS